VPVVHRPSLSRPDVATQANIFLINSIFLDLVEEPELTLAALGDADSRTLRAPLPPFRCRGAPPCGEAALANLIQTVAAILLTEPTLREIDPDPAIVHPAGEGLVALEPLILADDRRDGQYHQKGPFDSGGLGRAGVAADPRGGRPLTEFRCDPLSTDGACHGIYPYQSYHW
jgi:hypothetical protein